MCVQFLLLLFLVIGTRGYPPKDELERCTWNESNTPFRVLCKGLTSDRELTSALRPIRGRDIYEVVIQDSYFNYVPSEAFEDIRLKNLYLRDTSLRSISETDRAFVGLENSLVKLQFRDCIFMGDWDWDWLKLSHLTHLKYLHFYDTPLKDIDVAPEFTKNLLYLTMSGCHLQRFDDTVFAHMEKLVSLRVLNNAITEIKRSMLPNPANKLSILNLGSNHIDRLPEDMFSNMPKLAMLTLSGNNLLFLDEKTLGRVMPQLLKFHVQKNRLVCDCRMKWILRSTTFPQHMKAVCEMPAELRGTEIQKLQSRDLWCFHLPQVKSDANSRFVLN